jgi:hypothetical protein
MRESCILGVITGGGGRVSTHSPSRFPPAARAQTFRRSPGELRLALWGERLRPEGGILLEVGCRAAGRRTGLKTGAWRMAEWRQVIP